MSAEKKDRTPSDILNHDWAMEERMNALHLLSEKRDSAVKKLCTDNNELFTDDNRYNKALRQIRVNQLKELAAIVIRGVKQDYSDVLIDLEYPFVLDRSQMPYYDDLSISRKPINESIGLGESLGTEDFLDILEPLEETPYGNVSVPLLAWERNWAIKLFGKEYHHYEEVIELYQPTSVPGVEVELSYGLGDNLPHRRLILFDTKRYVEDIFDR